MLKYLDRERTLISYSNDDETVVVVVEAGDPRFNELAALGPAEFQDDPELALEAERAAMVVSRFQARVAMLDAGILAEVETALAGAGVLAQMAWAEATEFRRNSPMIAGIAAGLGLSPEQVDDLFRAAAAVVV